MYIIQLASGAYVIVGHSSWSPTMLRSEATKFTSEKRARMKGGVLLGSRPFNVICV